MIIDSLRDLINWLRPSSVRRQTRMTEQEALAIATKALGGQTGLAVFDVLVKQHGLEWCIGTPVLGDNEEVFIDDATGTVLRVKLHRHGPPRPRTRLTEEEAIAIASKALGGEMVLAVLGVIATAHGVEWFIVTPTLGNGQGVYIDDATGAVLRIESYRRESL
jgi:uncharacterized membrane protein YkoI